MAFHDTINTGTTPNDGQGDGLRTNIRKLHDNTKDNKQRLDELNGNTPGVVSSNGITVLTPLDGLKGFSFTQTGALKISLAFPSPDTMMSLSIWIYNYNENKSIKMNLYGYAYIYNSSNLWVKTSVQIITSISSGNIPVRFGHDGNKFCIYLGELNSLWDYPKVVIKDLMVGNSNITPVNWLTGWNISLETSSFQNITATHTNNLPVAQ